MAGGSPRHNALCVNAAAELRAALRGGPCRTFSPDQRVGLGPGERYVYPDVTVVCGPVHLEAGTTDVVANPTVLVEVLSESTEQYDRGAKWDGYQRIAALTDYVLVSQSEPRLEHFSRDPDGSWRYRAAGPGESISLTGGAILPVDTVFEGVMDLPGG
jgi:Uma2 family endonuclease